MRCAEARDITFRGTVTPQGDLLMKGSDGAVVTAKMDVGAAATSGDRM
jgi:hypothetical protein